MNFEAATYELLRFEPEIRASHLLYYRVPVQKAGVKVGVPTDLSGRRLMIFERAEGVPELWNDLSANNKVSDAHSRQPLLYIL